MGQRRFLLGEMGPVESGAHGCSWVCGSMPNGVRLAGYGGPQVWLLTLVALAGRRAVLAVGTVEVGLGRMWGACACCKTSSVRATAVAAFDMQCLDAYQ